ncbi:hypothetical protein WME91_45250 [Sorangium sp. So ce269]
MNAVAPGTLELLLADALDLHPTLALGLPELAAGSAPRPERTPRSVDALSREMPDADPNDLALQRWSVIAPEADGRPDPRGYAAYADKVVRWAREPTGHDHPDALFFVADDGTGATRLGRHLLSSLASRWRTGRAGGPFPRRASWISPAQKPRTISSAAAARSGPPCSFP